MRQVSHAAHLPVGLAALLMLSLALVLPTAHAQKKTDAAAEQRRAEQVRKLQANNQQLEADRARLQKEKEESDAALKAGEAKAKEAQAQAGKLSRELATLRQRLADVEKAAAQTSADMSKQTAQLTAAQQLLEQRSATIESLNKSLQQTQAQLRDSEGQLLASRNAGQGLSTPLNACAKHNRNLVGLVDEVSEKYRVKSCADARTLIEPLMGLRRAEFDRVAEEYRSKAGDERYVQPLKP